MLSEEVVSKLRADIVGKFCQGQCGGSGSLLIKKEGLVEFVDCNCIKEFRKQAVLIKANIPPKHWDFSLRNLTAVFLNDNREEVDLIKNYCNNIQAVVDAGAGLFIQGISGLAKSALAYYILKKALDSNIEGYTVRMSTLTTYLLESFKDDKIKQLLDWIKQDVRILVIDEIDKDYKISRVDTFSGLHVNEYLSYLYDKKVALVVTSNTPFVRTELERVHAPNIVDRFMELTPITLTGESYRGRGSLLEQILT